MARDRYVLLGLGRPRAQWLSNVSTWATSGSLAIEFIKCLSGADVRQRIADMRPYSALLVEVGAQGTDTELLDFARRHELPVIAVAEASKVLEAVETKELGVSEILGPDFSPADLLIALSNHSKIVTSNTDIEPAPASDPLTAVGDLIVVCGPGGTGTSTIAIAIAEGLASEKVNSGLVLLADFARNNEQAMLNDVRDVVPGIEELVNASRSNRATGAEVRSLCYAIAARGYDLLLGQRRASSWTSMPQRAIRSALGAIRRTYLMSVVDITNDFEGELDGGSIDLEERNALSRTALFEASVVVLTGMPGMKGVHSLAKLIREVIDLGVQPERIVTVVNRAPRKTSARSETTKTLASLVHLDKNRGELTGPIFVPERNVDAFLRDGVRLPRQVVEPVTAGIKFALERNRHDLGFTFETSAPLAVEPGSLGMLDEHS